MSKKHDKVDRASNDAYPVSDLHSWTPGTGSGGQHIRARVQTAEGCFQTILVEGGRGQELCEHLASHGIQARIDPFYEGSLECLDVEGDVDADVLQAIVDNWEQ